MQALYPHPDSYLLLIVSPTPLSLIYSNYDPGYHELIVQQLAPPRPYIALAKPGSPSAHVHAALLNSSLDYIHKSRSLRTERPYSISHRLVTPPSQVDCVVTTARLAADHEPQVGPILRYVPTSPPPILINSHGIGPVIPLGFTHPHQSQSTP